MQRSATVEVHVERLLKKCFAWLFLRNLMLDLKYTVKKYVYIYIYIPRKRCSHFFDDPVKELAPAHELQYHVKVLRVVPVEAVDLYHVRVVEIFQDAYLPRNRRYVCRM